MIQSTQPQNEKFNARDDDYDRCRQCYSFTLFEIVLLPFNSSFATFKNL